MRTRKGPGKGFRLWLPLFLIWPPVVVLAVVLSPLAMLAVMVLVPREKWRKTLLTGPALFILFCAARGFSMRAGKDEGGFEISLR